GQKAESDGKYQDAIDYYDEFLKSDPGNSEALYGKASAELKNAGLDIAELLPNILNQDASGADDLISQINFNDLEAGTAAAIEALEKIASGQADGTIPADNVDVNLNLAIAKTIHAVAKLINDNNIKIKDDFSIEGEVTSGKDEAIAEIESAIEYLEVAAATADIDIDEIKTSFETFKNNL
ncbi:MAG: hypothetical protein IIC07_05220, partial [Proteobacteria bacterium]|nr:hypothetical protein [Pseudomonadota bacterium]